MFLDEIVAWKRSEIARRQLEYPQAELERQIRQQAPPLSLAAALRGPGLKLIAEVKKASPSRGILRPDFDPVALASAYAEGGAAAISVLTEERFFQGSLEYLSAIRRAVGDGVPLLRKDFILEPYQVYESRAYGADSLLLIAAILNRQKLLELMGISRALGMDCLVEVHNLPELEAALDCGAEIVGINNRNLGTFEVDMNTTRQLRPRVPVGHIVVSESGISCRQDVLELAELNVNAVLVGEALVTAPDTIARMEELLGTG